MGSFLGVPIVVEGEPYGNLYLAIDHAQRYTGSEAQRWQLHQANQALDATIQIARALGG